MGRVRVEALVRMSHLCKEGGREGGREERRGKMRCTISENVL
jgi:hypothetical protein